MSIIITTVAKELFEKICARFANVGVNDITAKATQRPEDARFFNFNYLDSSGKNFGNITVSIANEEDLKISYGMKLSADLDEKQKAEWYDFLRDMRMFAKRNMLGFIPKDISKERLNPKDIKKISSVDSIKTRDSSSIAESKLFGTSKTSYEAIAPGVRLTIRHSGTVDETVNGARTRKIQSVYIEDAEGQRFKSPTNHLSCCRALGRHIAAGGAIGDEFGQHIVEMSQEMGKIKTFIRRSKNKVYENDEANDMAQAAVDRFYYLKKVLGSLSHNRSYKVYKEGWEPSESDIAVDLDEVRSKFTVKNFDSALEDALPYVYKAYQEKNTVSPVLQSQVDEFTESLDALTEDDNLSLTDAQLHELTTLMSSPLMSGGLDGLDSGAILQSIFYGTNVDLSSLLAKIYKVSDINDEVDIRPIVFDWLQDNVPDIGQRVEQSLKHGGSSDSYSESDATSENGDYLDQNEEEPDVETDDSTEKDADLEEPAPKASEEPVEPEQTDDLADIKRLSGIKSSKNA